MRSYSSSEIAIYVVTHDRPVSSSDPCMIPIQAGAALTNQQCCSVTDHTASNISEKNREFCELTALYWIWKNDAHEIVGLNHYRRKFRIDADTIRAVLTTQEIILPPPYYFRTSLEKEYRKHHVASDLLLLSRTVDRLYPQMSEALREILAGNMLIPYNMFIANRSLMNDYCSRLFSILFSMEKELDFEMRDVYQRRVFGFLAERLFTAYVREKDLKTHVCPVQIPETEKRLGRIKYFCGAYFNQAYFKWITKNG